MVIDRLIVATAFKILDLSLTHRRDGSYKSNIISQHLKNFYTKTGLKTVINEKFSISSTIINESFFNLSKPIRNN